MKIRGTTIVTPLSRAAVAKDDVVSKEPWSGKNIVDKLCPSFQQGGHFITCEPVEGYPMAVQAQPGLATEVTRCGKNLLDLSEAMVKAVSFMTMAGSNDEDHWGVELILPPGTYTIKAIATGTTGADYIYGAVTDLTNTKRIQSFNPVTGSPADAISATFTEWVRLVIYNMVMPISGGYTKADCAQSFSKYNIQLEVGNTATEFEPYKGETIPMTENADGVPVATVPALAGINHLWVDDGELTVTGKADPVAIINKLTNAIVALGGNV